MQLTTLNWASLYKALQTSIHNKQAEFDVVKYISNNWCGQINHFCCTNIYCTSNIISKTFFVFTRNWKVFMYNGGKNSTPPLTKMSLFLHFISYNVPFPRQIPISVDDYLISTTINQWKKMKLTEITTWQELISLSMPASIEQPNCTQLKISQ